MLRRQRPGTPVAVLRIDDKHLVGLVLAELPELDEMQALLDAVTDAEGRLRRAPEAREGVADQPVVDRFVEGDAARRRRRREGRIALHVAIRPVGIPVVAHEPGDIGRMRRLDLEAPDFGRDRLDRDVVLLGAEHRLGFVLHLDGDVPGSPRDRQRGEESERNRERAKQTSHGDS